MTKWIAREQLIGAGNHSSLGAVLVRGESFESVLNFVKDYLEKASIQLTTKRYKYIPMNKDTQTFQMMMIDTQQSPAVISGKRKPTVNLYSIIRIVEEDDLKVKTFYAAEYFHNQDIYNASILFNGLEFKDIRNRVLNRVDNIILDSLKEPVKLAVVPKNETSFQIVHIKPYDFDEKTFSARLYKTIDIIEEE